MNSINIKVNGTDYQLDVNSSETLLDILRNRLGLMGAKEGCGVGECGACTVILNERAVNSCLVPAYQTDGGVILTVEGLAASGELDALQKSFMNNHAVQCGYCTPGMLMSAKALLMEKANPTEAEIRQAISGNLCRCTGYENIVKAIQETAKEKAE